MRKSVFQICLFAFALLLFSCKKQENDINRGSISLILMPPAAVDTSGFVKSYLLKGAIVAPGAVDFKEYGFVVSGGGSITQYMSLGSGEKAGVVEAPFASPFKYENLTVLLYGVLKNGDTLISKSDSNLPPTVGVDGTGSVTDLYHTIGGTEIEKFTGTLINDDVVNFKIVEQGIEHSPQAVYESSQTFTQGVPGNPINTTEASVGFVLELPTSGNFASKSPYYFRIYFKLLNINTGTTTTIYSGAMLFTSQTITPPVTP